jgi:uncharacterized membrane protein YqiK
MFGNSPLSANLLLSRSTVADFTSDIVSTLLKAAVVRSSMAMIISSREGFLQSVPLITCKDLLIFPYVKICIFCLVLGLFLKKIKQKVPIYT